MTPDDWQMKFSDYEKLVLDLAAYPNIGANPIYPTLGLVGEAGEVAEKIKKLWRNENKCKGSDYSVSEKRELMKEMGDVLWYLAALAKELDSNLNYIAHMNASKLLDRNARSVIKGAGDNR